MAAPSSSPPNERTAAQDALAWYKAQYELLESELTEFKESSMELEKELERDIEEAEKRERTLQKRLEELTDEVEEWKRKAKESKSEANSAQTTLEREITTLRDGNRTFQLKLRDIEVANDAIERQARNTTSSLEDMESKYIIAVERAIMLEDDVKMGEQEREQLRIDSHRLKEELADLKIEAEVLQDRLRKNSAERHLSYAISTDQSVVESPTFDRNHVENSPGSTASSPLVNTPLDGPSHSLSPSPPSPSQLSVRPSVGLKAKLLQSASTTNALAPKPRLPREAPAAKHPRIKQPPRTSLGGSLSAAAITSCALPQTPLAPRRHPSSSYTPAKAPKSKTGTTSLTRVRSLRVQMQQLQERVNSVRSKMPLPPLPSQPPPPPPPTPPQNRQPLQTPHTARMPATPSATSKRRHQARNSIAGSVNMAEDAASTPAYHNTARHMPRLSTSSVPISRLSFGLLPNRKVTAAFSTGDETNSRTSSGPSSHLSSRPSSRASIVSSSRAEMVPPPRPHSRARPRSSIGMLPIVSDDGDESYTRTPSRRSIYSRPEMEIISSIPTPAAAAGRRVSGGGFSRRTSLGPAGVHKGTIEELGETF